MLRSHLEKYSHKKNLLIGIITILFINIIAFPYFPLLFPESPFSPHNILDIHFGFTAETVQHTLSQMQKEGRHIYYLSTIIIDMPYTLIYGFVLSLLMAYLLKKKKTHQPQITQNLIFMPFFISFFDIIENGGIICFIHSYPEINPHLIQLISISNQLKWTMVIMVSVAVLILLFRSFGKNNPPHS
jgi:uncharacterized membrane protein YadS